MITHEVASISHEGEVVLSDISAGYVLVKIEQQTECSACIATKLCNKISSDKQQMLRIETKEADVYSPGDFVIVRGNKQMHRKAILLATIMPCIILIATMLIVYLLTFNEGLSAIVGLVVMLLFFTLLYIFRNKIAREFVFSISHK